VAAAVGAGSAAAAVGSADLAAARAEAAAPPGAGKETTMFRTLLGKKAPAPAEALERLREELVRRLGNRLKSLLVFGSYVTGEFQEGRSDLNVLIVVDDVHFNFLSEVSDLMSAWVSEGNPMPVLLQANELDTYSRSLPVEFSDIGAHHRILAGQDLFASVTFDPLHLRAQCQQELAVKLLKLRQQSALHAAKPEPLRELAIESLPSIVTLFRAVLRLEEDVSTLSKLDAGQKMATKAGFDAHLLHQIHDLRLRRKTDNLTSLFSGYLDCVEKVLHYVAKV
jgi:predicted nucleotidyltransferase